MRPCRPAVAVALLASTGCSLFVPHTQRVTVRAWSPAALIQIDDVPVGTGRVQADVSRNKAHVFSATLAGRREAVVVDKHISVTGVLDVVGGIFFLVPIVGTFAPGFYDLDRTDITLPPHPEPVTTDRGVARGSFSR